MRTGQAGLAPERDVIDNYDIAGYFSKTEMTQNKLYSVIKSSVRQYLAFGMAQATIDLLNNLVAALRLSRENPRSRASGRWRERGPRPRRRAGSSSTASRCLPTRPTRSKRSLVKSRLFAATPVAA